MYKYSLNEPGEEDLLAPPEGTVDAQGRPSPLTGDMLNLSALEAPPPPPPTPAPEAPVVGEGTGSYLDDAKKANPAMFSSHYTMDQWNDANARQKAANEEVATTGETAQSRLVSAAPDWYKGGEPPKGHSGWATAANVLGGALAAPAAQRLKDPNRLAGLKQKDARQVALASGMSTLFSSLFNQGKENYDAKQAAALKEAQMMHSLPGGKTGSQIKREGADKTIEQMQRDLANDSVSGQRKFVQDTETAKHNKDSPEVQAMIQTLVKMGRGTPEELSNLTYEGLVHLMGAVNQRNSAEAVAANAEAGAINNERKAALEHGYKSKEQYDKETQEEARRRDESNIPGIEWNGAPPPKEVVNKLRETSAKATTFVNRLDRMVELQKQLNELGVGYRGAINEWLGKPEVKALQNEAARLQDAIGFAIRSADYGNFGVPQQWEALKVAAMAPQAGTPTGYLRGVQSWEAIAKDVKNMWADHVHYANAHFPGEEGRDVKVTGDRPAPVAADAPARAAVRHGKVVQDEPTPTDDTGGLGTTAATPPKVPGATPAPALAPKLEPGQKMYKVTKKDGTTKPKAMTPEDAKLLASHTDLIASVVEQ